MPEPILIKFEYIKNQSAFNELENIRVSDIYDNPICGVQKVTFCHEAGKLPIMKIEVIPHYVIIVAEDIEYEVEAQPNGLGYKESVKGENDKLINYLKGIEFHSENLELKLTL